LNETLIGLIERLGKSEGYVGGALLIVAATMALRVGGWIDGSTLSTVVIGVWAAAAGGGAAAAYRR